MPDLVSTLLILAVILLLADLVLAGGAMVMTGMSGMVGAFAHPLAAGALIAAVIVVAIIAGGRT